MKRLPLLAVCIGTACSAAGLPKVTVTHDDTVIRESCEIVIPPGTVIADSNGNGVLRIEADDVTVRFAAGSVLRGAAEGTPWDGLRGIGIRVIGRRGVRVQEARVHGYFNGLVATHADALELAGGDYSDNYRQRLRSTPESEDGSDWLFPHHNDERKWRDEYGGAVCVESSAGVTIRDLRVRRGQNGIVLDRVTDSSVYDNDASFLSGWGLALWRSSRNVVARNAFDFCVRGHVEGVYNRGQDSAGILCFEQCNDNVFASNSVTHGGDGFFGFAGREALGEIWMEAERIRLRAATGKEDVDGLIRVPVEVAKELSARGCNRNRLIGNDFSYAAAHGIEMTFSEGNVIAGNRLVENAICGVWGGYSSDTWMVDNTFEGNGGMAYGLERGAINMEHGFGNRILGNRFRNDKCAIHLWWDNDAGLLKLPGVAGHPAGVHGNVVAGNRFEIGPDHPFRNLGKDERLVVLQLRDDGVGNVRDNVYTRNTVVLTASNAVEFAFSKGCEAPTAGPVPKRRLPRLSIPGRANPVGARSHLRGRDKIVMDDWGPWDHEEPLLRQAASTGGKRVFDLFGTRELPRAEVLRGNVEARWFGIPDEGRGIRGHRLEIQGPPGVTPYEVRVSAGDWTRAVGGTWVSTTWDCVFFPWPADTDPREKPDAWRRLAEGPLAVRASSGSLDFAYGWGGPKDLRLEGDLRAKGPGGDRFGMIARTRLALPRGTWRWVSNSDDGIRVKVGSRVVLENWTWHGPTRDQAEFVQETDGEVNVEVEHFEIDGFSVLRLELQP
ncbi:MAG: right-handed parallel beta-helix repeat-containing protein [Verrucomicrobiales bacterium]|nr:right-handed parallel beta-helix repeat-containing protein [Verrucomicrobiales bacterium]